MKLTITLSHDDVAWLDEYVRATGLRSRAAAIEHAVRLLREADLEQDYIAAWEEWESSEDRHAWEGTVGDGLADATR